MEPVEFLRAVWSVQGEGTGFVCRRRNNTSWFETAVKVPSKLDDLKLEWDEEDTYFTPNLFGANRRRSSMKPSRWLYADLDGVDPRGFEGERQRLRPTVAWETSPGRYQALWLVQRLRLESHERLNKQLSYAVGADHSGWDATQVLRLPGTRNHKYDELPEVKLLWWDGGERKVSGTGMKVDTGAGEGLRVVELRGKRAPSWIRQRLRTQQPAGDRSKVLFRMECDLLAKGWTKDEVFTLLRESVWNKFDDKRLSDDIHRAAERLR